MKDVLRIVVKKRAEANAGTEGVSDRESLSRFSTRVSKLHGEGSMSSSNEPEVTLEVVSINIADIEVPPNYVRQTVGDVAPLVASIKIYGIQQPLKVVKIKGTKKFRLVFGRRRLAAAKLAGFEAVPCIVELVTKEDRLQMLAMAENIHRCALSAVEQGQTLEELKKNGVTLSDIATNLEIGLDRIKELIDLMALPEPIRKEVLKNPDQFTLALLKALRLAYQKSEDFGKRFFSAVLSGNISSPKEVQAFLTSSK